jgi:hypothetical protein
MWVGGCDRRCRVAGEGGAAYLVENEERRHAPIAHSAKGQRGAVFNQQRPVLVVVERHLCHLHRVLIDQPRLLLCYENAIAVDQHSPRAPPEKTNQSSRGSVARLLTQGEVGVEHCGQQTLAVKVRVVGLQPLTYLQRQCGEIGALVRLALGSTPTRKLGGR